MQWHAHQDDDADLAVIDRVNQRLALTNMLQKTLLNAVSSGTSHSSSVVSNASTAGSRYQDVATALLASLSTSQQSNFALSTPGSDTTAPENPSLFVSLIHR
ncbi:hypothetical protein Ciccas_001026 [Cichlidogyrus casuarinus]|uniref:Uncharacterized protein n=1 Tax=Cichlidogyrus casuarinus TaxID=1844966 RepID=A0ABD2QL75_9PLAT